MTARLADMREDVQSWDVRVEREWPFGVPRVAVEAVPPVRVCIGVNFTSEASALEFEVQVRRLLAPGSAGTSRTRRRGASLDVMLRQVVEAHAAAVAAGDPAPRKTVAVQFGYTAEYVSRLLKRAREGAGAGPDGPSLVPHPDAAEAG